MYSKYEMTEMKRIWDDITLYELILKLEVANVEAWHIQGRIPEEDLQGLESANIDWSVYETEFTRSGHDLNSLVAAIAATLPSACGRWLHYQLTTYDVWDTARLKQMRDSITLILQASRKLLRIAKRQSLKYRHTLMAGRTHGVHAEPTTFGYKILAKMVVPLADHIKHLECLREELQLGKFSGAVGTHANVPDAVERYVCRKLGVRPVLATTQVVQREWFLRYVNHLAELTGTLQNFFTDIRLMAQTEVCEVEEPFEEGHVRSSAMPHKRNPELSERICSISLTLPGYCMMAQATVTLWHERVLINSGIERIYLPDASLATYYILHLASYILGGLRVFPERMDRNLGNTAHLLASGRLSNKLVEKGLARPDAYKLAQTLASRVWEAYQKGDTMPSLRSLALTDPSVNRHLDEKEIRDCFDADYENVLKGVDVGFHRAGL